MKSNLQVLNEKVDGFLADYPYYPYQTAIANPELRQTLLTYIMHKIQEFNPTLKEPQNQQLPKLLHQSLGLRLRLESYIYWGIECIVQNKLELLSNKSNFACPSLTPEIEPIYAPSEWFG